MTSPATAFNSLLIEIFWLRNDQEYEDVGSEEANFQLSILF